MALSTAFIAYQVSLQKTIYFWDYLETWRPLVQFAPIVLNDPIQSLTFLEYTINYSDYNNFLPMLMILPAQLFGKSFLAYTLYVWTMFALPALFLTAAAIKSALQKLFDIEISCASALVILMFVPQLQIPVMNGYANIAMLSLAIIVLLILLNLDAEKFQPIRLTCASLLSMIAVIQNRTAAYMIVGIYFGYIVYTAVGGC